MAFMWPLCNCIKKLHLLVLQELINKSNQVAQYKVNISKSTAFYVLENIEKT